MAFSYDPQIESALKDLLAAMGEVFQPEPGDWKSLRDGINTMMTSMQTVVPVFPDVVQTRYKIIAGDGTEIALRWYTKKGAASGAAVLYLHGGGMICGSVDLYNPLVSAYVDATGVPMLAVEYRLAPEYPHPTPVEDCYAGLRWLVAQAGNLGIDATRIAVMGDSAGGGLAAGVALLARDRGLHLARQLLIYPMLDDRNVIPDALLTPFATWTYDNNFTGWSALLGKNFGTGNVDPSAAPSRAHDLAGLAPAYIEVGELDIFRDEDIKYASRLAAAGVSTELHVHPGAPHGFEGFAPGSDVAKRAMADRFRVLGTI
jgi:acetyl esterase/lipase